MKPDRIGLIHFNKDYITGPPRTDKIKMKPDRTGPFYLGTNTQQITKNRDRHLKICL